MHVIDAFDVPKSIYCDQTKKLVKYKSFVCFKNINIVFIILVLFQRISNDSKTYQNLSSRSVIGKANAKIELFIQRFKIMQQVNIFSNLNISLFILITLLKKIREP